MEAFDALNKCIAINGYYKAYFARAMLHHSMGNLKPALADIEHVLAVQPQHARAWFLKGNCMEQQGNMNVALDNYTKAIAYDSTEPLFYVRRGIIFSKINDRQGACRDFQNALRLGYKDTNGMIGKLCSN